MGGPGGWTVGDSGGGRALPGGSLGGLSTLGRWWEAGPGGGRGVGEGSGGPPAWPRLSFAPVSARLHPLPPLDHTGGWRT